MRSGRELGQFGESAAEKFLRRKGYAIVERNFSCRFGEIDIIARKKEYIVFVEVKLRKNADYGAGTEFVTPAKQRRIIIAAQLWLSKNECELQPRFDVVEIYAPQGEKTPRLEINHIENAFELM